MHKMYTTAVLNGKQCASIDVWPSWSRNYHAYGMRTIGRPEISDVICVVSNDESRGVLRVDTYVPALARCIARIEEMIHGV